MSNNSRVYRNSLTDKILLGFGTVMFAFLAYVAWVNQFGYENRMVIAFLMFAVLCLVGFLFSFYSVTLTEKEIIARRFFRESKLLWSDIYEVIPDSLDSFSLSDRNGDVKVFISSQVKDYVELVGLIKQSRPDIWEVRNSLTVQDTQAFHKNPWSAIQYSLIGVGMIVTSLVAPSDGRGNEL